jgi:hypothetical protein
MPFKPFFIAIYASYIALACRQAYLFISNSPGISTMWLLQLVATFFTTAAVALFSEKSNRISNIKGLLDLAILYPANLLVQVLIFYTFNSDLF